MSVELEVLGRPELTVTINHAIKTSGTLSIDDPLSATIAKGSDIKFTITRVLAEVVTPGTGSTEQSIDAELSVDGSLTTFPEAK